MKTKLILSGILSFIFCLLSSQVPQGFNYQAVARDAGGTSIINTAMQVRITIQSDSSLTGGTIFWQELHNSVTTNSFGLINVVLGKGSKVTGIAPAFSAIDWSITPKFIKTEINYGGWKMMGISRLWSVPYSMVAGDLGGPLKKLSVTGKTSVMDEALFEVKNKDGNTVFAVYNEGVRVYVADGAKGLKGGFAVGGFGSDKAESQKYFVVSKDSARIYIDSNPLTKKAKGGFAVGGYDMTKAQVEEYLRVTRDSTRVYIRNSGKGLKGGFAVGGFDATKGPVNNYMTMNPDNYFIGENSGVRTTTGLFNSFMGFETGYFNTSGSYNALFGYQSGYKNSTGNSNLFVGYQSGYNNTTGHYNSFLGYQAGFANSTGAENSFLGSFAGLNNSSGTFNSFVGYKAGYANTTGSYNNFFGTQSGYSNLSGNYNTFLGPQAGNANLIGSANVYIGYLAGAVADSSMDNVFIGNRAGEKHSTEIGGINAGGNVYIGSKAGQNDNAGSRNVFIGWQSGMSNTKGVSNVFISSASGQDNTTGYSNVLIGDQAGTFNTTGYENVIIGRAAGYSNTTGYRNVFLGYKAGWGIAANNRLCIGEGDASSSLIYGEFDNKFLRFNGSVNLNGNLSFNTGTNRHIIFPDPLYTLYVGGQPGVTHAPYAISFVTEGPASIGNTGLIMIGPSQNVGIGRSPAYKLDVSGDRIRLINDIEWIAMRTDGTAGFLDLSYSGGKLVIQGSGAGEDILINPSLGNKVGIRTWAPQYDLDVNGSIRAIGSVYYGGTTVSANGAAYSKPDYVFNDTYKPLSIEAVKEFLQNENHLPWITSVKKEKEENGDAVDMTRMAFETVETIENLQLQIIEMNNQIKTISEQVKIQQIEIENLKKMLKLAN